MFIRNSLFTAQNFTCKIKRLVTTNASPNDSNTRRVVAATLHSFYNLLQHSYFLCGGNIDR